MNATHEIRIHDYRKGPNHVEILCSGTEQECTKFLEKEALDRGVGPSFLTGNGGYRFVDLEEEKLQKARAAGPDLLLALETAEQTLSQLNINAVCDNTLLLVRNAIKKATA